MPHAIPCRWGGVVHIGINACQACMVSLDVGDPSTNVYHAACDKSAMREETRATVLATKD